MERQQTSTSIKTKTIQSPYDYYAIYKSVLAKGEEIFGPGFEIDDIDRPVIMRLITYFLQDESVATDQDIDLYKGLLITGPIGCGKTAIMQIINALLPQEKKYIVRSCRSISMDYIADGHETIRRYTTDSFELYSKKPKTVYFDDVGCEHDVNHWGNLNNVMETILLLRYESFMDFHMQTYISTNLSSTELEVKYGPRVRSRLRQMCQLIAFSTESKDKRK